MRKYKILKKIAAITLIVSMSVQPVFAKSSFKGWYEDEREDALDVYASTEWFMMQKDLILEQLERSAEATDLSYSTKFMRPTIEKVVKEMFESSTPGIFYPEEYTEILLALMEVLSDGQPTADDPCNIKGQMYPAITNIDAETSIEKMAYRLFSCERAYLETHNQPISYYKMDDALKCVLQGVVYGSDFSKTYSAYNLEASKNYKRDHKDYFDNIGIDPDPEFANKVAMHYTCSEVTNGILDIGPIDEKNLSPRQVALVKEASKLNSYGAGQGWCQKWVADCYLNAGQSPRMSKCCAHAAGDAWVVGKRDAKNIPVGATLYSSRSLSNKSCSCGRNAGHVAIYIGNGMVAHNGARVEIVSLKKWLDLYDKGKGYYMGWGWNGGENLAKK